MSIVDDTATINDKLSDWIINTSPPAGDAAAQAQMQQAVALHRQLDQLITRAQLIDLQEQGKALELLEAKQGALVATLKDRINRTTDGIAQAEAIISIAAQAVAIIVQVAALAA